MEQYEGLIEVDELSLYFGEPCVINKYITVHQPKIGDIIAYHEKDYYGMVQSLTAIPTEMRVQLWDMTPRIDWTMITDFQLFTLLAPSFNKEKTEILLGNLDLSKLRPMENLQNGEIVLKDPDSDVVIDELAYKRMTAYICKMHNLTKKVEKAANEYTKKFMIDEARQKMEYESKKPYKSFLLPLISSVKARQGYTKDYVRNMGLCEFFDEVSRLQIIVNSDALLQGSYSGMIDTSKINKSQFNWMREITEK